MKRSCQPHYLPENNNANTRLLGLSQCSLSELVSCSTIHSISTSCSAPGFAPPSATISPFNSALPTLPRITSPCRAGWPHHHYHSTRPQYFSPNPSLLTSSHSAGLGCSTPPPYLVLMSHCEIQADGWGTKGWEEGPPLPVPLVSLPTRLWVIFSSFHGGAMNNLSLLCETPFRHPPLSYLTLCRLARAGCSSDSISQPRFLLTVSALHTQSFFFFVSRGVLQGPEINWGCGCMTSGPSFMKAWVLEVCRVYNEVYIS